jgi:Calcium-dependent channel, 7TM region, putative phosphate
LIGKKHKDLQIGKLISFSLTVVLCLPWLEPVLAQLAPLLVVVANLALKWILEFLSSFEGPISGAVIQASLFGKLSVFMIIQTFFVSAISGSLISQLTAMLQGTKRYLFPFVPKNGHSLLYD